MQLQVLEVLAQRSIFVAAPLGMACIMCLQRSVSTYPYLEVTQSVNMIGFNDLWSLVTHTQQRWGGNWTSCYTHLPVARVCWSVYTSQRQFSPNPFNHTTKGGSTLVAEMNSGNGVYFELITELGALQHCASAEGRAHTHYMEVSDIHAFTYLVWAPPTLSGSSAL